LLPRPLPALLRPFQTVAAWLDATWPARKLSGRSRWSFPLGYLVIAQKTQPSAGE
jgi:hypothetical protein